MKKLISLSLVILLFFALPSLYADVKQRDNLKSFLDIPFGSSPEYLKKSLSDRDNFTFVAVAGDIYMYTGIYKGKPAEFLFYFYDNQFFRGLVAFTPKEGDVIKLYREVVEIVKLEYGNPDNIIENFNNPYRNGDGMEELAISINEAFFLTDWFFNDNNEIFCAIANNLITLLSFTNTKISAIEQEAKAESY